MFKNTALAEQMRRTAYFLWEQDGRPDGSAMTYWLRAKEGLLRQLAYDRWLAEGTPPGRSDQNWWDAERELGEK